MPDLMITGTKLDPASVIAKEKEDLLIPEEERKLIA